MADFSKFRASLNGFHRSDVVAYIETLCAEHQKALKAAQEESADLRQQLDDAQQELAAQISLSDHLQSELTATQDALKATEDALEEALTTLTEPDIPEEASEEAEPAAPDYAELELEAYRRAEAMERAANQRAAKLRSQLDELLEQVSNRYEQAGQEIQVLTEDIRINLKRLDETLSDLDAIFDEAKDGFEAMEENFPANE